MAKDRSKVTTKNPNIVMPEKKVFAIRLTEEERSKIRYIMIVHNLPDFSSTIRFLIEKECERLEGLENE